MVQVLLEKLTGLQLVKKFTAFHETRRFITALNKRPPPVPILGQSNPVHIPTSTLLEIHPNIIHPFTPRSPQWSIIIIIITIIILNLNSFICCEMRLQKVNCQLF